MFENNNSKSSSLPSLMSVGTNVVNGAKSVVATTTPSVAVNAHSPLPAATYYATLPPPITPNSPQSPNNNSSTYEVIPHRIFVGGFATGTTEQELRTYFETFGAVKEVKVIRNTEGTSKGYGFITYETETEAQAVRTTNSDKLELKGRRLNLGPAMRRINLNSGAQVNRLHEQYVSTPTTPHPLYTAVTPYSYPTYQTVVPIEYCQPGMMANPQMTPHTYLLMPSAGGNMAQYVPYTPQQQYVTPQMMHQQQPVPLMAGSYPSAMLSPAAANKVAGGGGGRLGQTGSAISTTPTRAPPQQVSLSPVAARRTLPITGSLPSHQYAQQTQYTAAQQPYYMQAQPTVDLNSQQAYQQYCWAQTNQGGQAPAQSSPNPAASTQGVYGSSQHQTVTGSSSLAYISGAQNIPQQGQQQTQSGGGGVVGHQQAADMTHYSQMQYNQQGQSYYPDYYAHDTARTHEHEHSLSSAMDSMKM